jgi:S1-C subfamily serine protease
MTTEQQTTEPPPTELAGCPRCHSVLAPGMQFCRSCGYRLFDGGVTSTSYAAANSGQMAPQAPWRVAKVGRSGPHWAIWLVIALIMSSAIGGGILSRGIHGLRRNVTVVKSSPSSYAGVDDVESVDGGAMIGETSPPGGPADKAGLIGGDIVTAVDGMPVKNHSDLTAVLGKTPIGKTVDVAYLRDGNAKTTKLTTASEDDIDHLNTAFGNIPHGFFGVDDYKRVQVPGQNFFGVAVGEVDQNRPAYTAGMREGDIVVEMDGTPIRTDGEFVQRIHRAKPESVVKVVVMRGAERKEIPVTVGIDD